MTYENFSTDIEGSSLHVYVQPGGCVDVTENGIEGLSEDEGPVHICDWLKFVAEVERIRDLHRAEGSHGFI